MTDAPPSMGMDPARFQQRKTVVIVDDSPLLRRWLRMVLEGNRRLVVVGEASDAREAGAVIKATRPDVITLDIQMPGMNGLEFLEKLMLRNPLPVVVFSGVTRANCETTVRALMLGAVDCLEKPENGTSRACATPSRGVSLPPPAAEYRRRRAPVSPALLHLLSGIRAWNRWC
ncbi:response regulator [Sulfitobacter porphyrae]|uniref:Response regulator n=1 Tax=Sulfitobacter porphyrae TaxID=1246864 RepID=A0ABW2B2I4_9RHOB